MAQRIRKGDTVLVLSGKDKGKRGEVIRVLPRENRVVVEGVNVVTRHVRQRPGVTQAGLVHGESPVHISNVMLVDPESQKPGRIIASFLDDGTKVRKIKSGKRS